ncbi:MAG: AAA family ATPase [Deltaproteobacteria bacterium]|nr:AAA family ATPase [Deltaproteobacteria bacterium]
MASRQPPRISGARTNVAPPNAPVIGRARDVAAVAALFGSGERLVTVVGPPGTGKTTLARRYLLDLDTARDASFCDLTEARDASEIRGVVSRDLGFTVGVDDAEPDAQIDAAIAARGELLVVLDNFEHVVAHGPATVGRWLAAAPRARFLVTSRERLRLPSEVVLPLEPLSLPAADERDPDVILASDAVKLLLDRARRVRGGFTPRDADVRVLADIVRELDGLPLAIELAAARLGVLGPKELLARLSRKLDLLSTGTRDAVARHATLRAAIEWSWTMLDARERSTLAQCAVFRGGFSLEAAEAVVDSCVDLEGADIDLSGTELLDVLQSLHDKSLVRAYEPTGTSGERRMGLFASIAEHAMAKLEASPLLGGARARHAAYFAAAGRRWAADVDGVEGTDRLRVLAIEQDNLGVVVERGLADDDPTSASATAADRTARRAQGLDAIVALDPLRTAQGPYDAHLSRLDRMLARVDDEHPVGSAFDRATLALAYDARARARFSRARPEEARADAERAVALADASDDDRVRGRVLSSFATMARQRGEMDVAMRGYARALEASRRAGDVAGEGSTLGNLAILHKECGRLVEARRGYEEALTLLRAVEDRRAEGRFRCDLGALHQEERRFEDARACFLAALEIHREVGNRRFEAIAASDLGALAFETHALGEADTALGDAVAILREVGDRRYEALFTGVRGAVQAWLGKLDEARASLSHAEGFLDRIGDALFAGAVRVHRGHLDLVLAKLADAAGDPGAAARHRDAARERLERAIASSADGAPSLASLSDDVRLAVRVLRAAIDEVAEATRTDALVIGPDARWFRAPGSTDRVELGNRGVARRLLAALADHRVAHAGAPLDLDALRERGWPDERVLSHAAANRIHVALSALRSLGLKSLLLRRTDGYLLDPAVPLLRSP